MNNDNLFLGNAQSPKKGKRENQYTYKAKAKENLIDQSSSDYSEDQSPEEKKQSSRENIKFKLKNPGSNLSEIGIDASDS